MGYKESKSLKVRDKDIVNLNAFWRERQQILQFELMAVYRCVVKGAIIFY